MCSVLCWIGIRGVESCPEQLTDTQTPDIRSKRICADAAGCPGSVLPRHTVCASVWPLHVVAALALPQLCAPSAVPSPARHPAAPCSRPQGHCEKERWPAQCTPCLGHEQCLWLRWLTPAYNACGPALRARIQQTPCRGCGEAEGVEMAVGLVCPHPRGHVWPDVCRCLSQPLRQVQEPSDCETLIYSILENVGKICKAAWPK